MYNYDYAIVVEDDIEIAPDFFQYMQATLPLMEEDAMLWCVSAWNDNGKEQAIDSSRNDLFYRTDFFPGLGWMLSRELWEELEPIWPQRLAVNECLLTFCAFPDHPFKIPDI